MKTIIFAIAFVLFTGIAQAQVPRTLNLQSIVYDVDGNITTAESVDLIVRIIDGSGNEYYQEEINSIPVVNGAINVEIGEATGGIPLSALDPSTGERLLDIMVDGDSPFDLLPISAVPYAIYAERALTVPEDSIESKHIKDGTVKLEDLEPGIAFSDIEGQIGEGQAPGSFTMDTELDAHMNDDERAHDASAIHLFNIGFHTFSADDVQDGIAKLDSRLHAERQQRQQADSGANTNITNLQSEVSSNDTDITNLQTTTSDINNIPGTLGEGKIDADIARDSELTFGNISGTISDGQIPASITRDSELSFGNISGQISDGQIPASIARDSEIPSVITDHGALGGLGDNDHPHYLQRSGAQAMTNNLNMGGNNITSVGTVDGANLEDISTIPGTLSDSQIPGTIARDTELPGEPTWGQLAVQAPYLKTKSPNTCARPPLVR